MDVNIKWLNQKKAENITRVLLGQEYETILVNSLDEIKTILLNKIPKEESIILGDSCVLEDLNLIDAFYKNGNYIFNYQHEPSLEIKQEIRRQGLLADTFITEIDFVTEQGELILQGGFSNCASIFGPNKIYGIIGINKIVKNLKDAEIKSQLILEANSFREKSYYDKDLYNNLGIIHNGKKFPNKYTLFVLNDSLGF
ncbi:Uncharacterised ACR, YkgG family COG1556 [Cetobacterium ceti]|uniref:Uncharacterized ACR, YkgG family COG1556 n=1 Tax=Cetobacterium ceti TaxID=180163 RepID=A0A1T4PF31_9FUSO|nr:LUD domain-containing protein [Cetobacterium ceti]SJZ90112.1 Uncharacterised ACR, YkgG family COG1556 [Cetobacterium ceti]